MPGFPLDWLRQGNNEGISVRNEDLSHPPVDFTNPDPMGLNQDALDISDWEIAFDNP